MTTADRTAAPAATSPDFVEHRVIRTHYEAPTYASVQPMPNYTVTRNGDRWGTLGYVAACGLIGLVLISAFVGITALIVNGGTFSRDWAAWKEVEVTKATTARAIGNADANARAGFGNNDATTQQVAVPRPPLHIEQTIAPNTIIQRTVSQKQSSICSTCVGGLPADRVAACSRLGPGHRLIAAPDGNYRCLDAQGRRVRPDGTLVAAR